MSCTTCICLHFKINSSKRFSRCGHRNNYGMKRGAQNAACSVDGSKTIRYIISWSVASHCERIALSVMHKSHLTLTCWIILSPDWCVTRDVLNWTLQKISSEKSGEELLMKGVGRLVCLGCKSPDKVVGNLNNVLLFLFSFLLFSFFLFFLLLSFFIYISFYVVIPAAACPLPAGERLYWVLLYTQRPTFTITVMRILRKRLT